jgi:VIT1/CCC1 family predicted Fe2+/Mn2+ transporter
MTHSQAHEESHKSNKVGWLRAAVLGANDGTISVCSLAIGVAASGAPTRVILLSTVAGVVAGAASMAAGEYVSVQSQADTESADIAMEKRELEAQPERELAELVSIYMRRGLDRPLAQQVAEKLTAANAVEAHARDELGITDTFRARPMQAAMASALSFLAGTIVPVLTIWQTPTAFITAALWTTSLLTLVVLGAVAAQLGGASLIRGALRVAFWGALAMGLTEVVGKLFGATV